MYRIDINISVQILKLTKSSGRKLFLFTIRVQLYERSLNYGRKIFVFHNKLISSLRRHQTFSSSKRNQQMFVHCKSMIQNTSVVYYCVPNIYVYHWILPLKRMYLRIYNIMNGLLRACSTKTYMTTTFKTMSCRKNVARDLLQKYMYRIQLFTK